jgi:hypothetical protein
LYGLLARKYSVAHEDTDVIDAKLPERACFFRTSDFIDLDEHHIRHCCAGRGLNLVEAWNAKLAEREAARLPAMGVDGAPLFPPRLLWPWYKT